VKLFRKKGRKSMRTNWTE